MPEYAMAQIVVADSAEDAESKWANRGCSPGPVSIVRAIPLATCEVAPPPPAPPPFDFAAWSHRMAVARGRPVEAVTSVLTGLPLSMPWSEALEIHMWHVFGNSATPKQAAEIAMSWERNSGPWPQWLRDARKANGQTNE